MRALVFLWLFSCVFASNTGGQCNFGDHDEAETKTDSLSQLLARTKASTYEEENEDEEDDEDDGDEESELECKKTKKKLEDIYKKELGKTYTLPDDAASFGTSPATTAHLLQGFTFKDSRNTKYEASEYNLNAFTSALLPRVNACLKNDGSTWGCPTENIFVNYCKSRYEGKCSMTHFLYPNKLCEGNAHTQHVPDFMGGWARGEELTFAIANADRECCAQLSANWPGPARLTFRGECPYLTAATVNGANAGFDWTLGWDKGGYKHKLGCYHMSDLTSLPLQQACVLLRHKALVNRPYRKVEQPNIIQYGDDTFGDANDPTKRGFYPINPPS